MGFYNYVKLWDDVLDPSLDEKTAPSLGEVYLGRADRVYAYAREFFRRTLLTRSMLDVLEEIAGALAGVKDVKRGYRKVHVLTSLFGGGKTHTLLTIYHALSNPRALLEARTSNREDRRRLESIVKMIEGLGGVKIAVVDGFFKELAPTPVDPYIVGNFRVQTIWGLIAFQLGFYSLVESHDKLLAAPQADAISGMLSKPTLILVDEIARYVANLAVSGDQRVRDYASQILGFMELLAKAIDLAERGALVVAIPVSIEGAGVRVEATYRDVSYIVEGLYKSLTRVAASIITPVTPRDLASILKTRIFERVDETGVKIVASKLNKAYQDYENLFGDEASRVIQELYETYPFHPAYIRTLSEIVDKHEMLQKTRDAIKLTRKILRILRRDKVSELIMPYHIDVEEDEIQGTLLIGDYRNYVLVVEEDIRRRCDQYDIAKRQIAKAIAKTVFAKTFVYQWVGGAKLAQLFPDSKDILLSSYEPGMAETLQVTPNDYHDALTWLSRYLAYMLEDGGRYWFTYLASPIREVEIMARGVDDVKALQVLPDHVGRILTGTIDDAIKARKPAKPPPVFSDVKILLEPEPVDVDMRAYVLLISLKPLDDSVLEKLVFETRKGARRYANTIYVMYSASMSILLQALWNSKLLMACDEVKKKWEEKPDVDRIVRDVMIRKLDEYCRGRDGVLGRLYQSILASLNAIAYPMVKDHRECVEKAQTVIKPNIIESALTTLKEVRPQKYYDRLDFDTLDYLLRQLGINLKEGDLERRVEDIIDFFYTNPYLPMVLDKQVKEALLEGVRRLEIGVRRGGTIHFKQITECRQGEPCRPPTVVEGITPTDLADDDVIVPWPRALKEQIESLKDVEERTDKGIRRIKHYFHMGGKLYDLKDAFENFSLESLQYAPIVKLVEELREGVDLKVKPQEVKSKPGEELSIDVMIERIGEFSGEVALEVSRGVIARRRLTVDEKNSLVIVPWRVKAPEASGEYRFAVKALSQDGRLLKEEQLKIIVVEVEKRCLPGAPPAGIKISRMSLRVEDKSLRPLEILINRFGDSIIAELASIEVGSEVKDVKSVAEVRLENYRLGEVKRLLIFLTNLAGIYLSRLSYELHIKPSSGDYVTAPTFDETERSYLKDLEYCMTEDIGLES